MTKTQEQFAMTQEQIAILQEQLDKQFRWLVGIVAYLSAVTWVCIVGFFIWWLS